MKQLFKSEITGKVYDSEKECLDAEKAHNELIVKESKAKEERKQEAEEIKKAYADYISLLDANKKAETESYNKYLELKNKFIDKYGSYHLTLTQKDDLKPTIKVGVDAFKDLINSYFNSDSWLF